MLVNLALILAAVETIAAFVVFVIVLVERL
jgi:hypothetical protein